MQQLCSLRHSALTWTQTRSTRINCSLFLAAFLNSEGQGPRSSPRLSKEQPPPPPLSAAPFGPRFYDPRQPVSFTVERSGQSLLRSLSSPTVTYCSANMCHAAVNQVCSLAALQWQGLEKVLRRSLSRPPSVGRPALIHQSRDQLSSSSRGPASHQPESRLPPARQATARLRPISHGIVIYILPISQKWIGIRDFTSFQWWHWRHKFWLLC